MGDRTYQTCYGAGRAAIHAGAAADAGFRDILIERRGQFTINAAVRKGDGGNADNLFAGAGAVGAEDAEVVAGLLLEARLRHAVFLAKFLDDLGIRTAGQEKFQYVLPQTADAIRIGLDLQAFFHLVDAGGDQPLASFARFYLDQAEPAGAVGSDGFILAECGNVDIMFAGDVEDSGTLFRFEFSSVIVMLTILHRFLT